MPFRVPARRHQDRCAAGRRWLVLQLPTSTLINGYSAAHYSHRPRPPAARHRDLAGSAGPESRTRREAFAREIDNYRARITRVAVIADQRRQDALAVDQQRIEEKT